MCHFSERFSILLANASQIPHSTFCSASETAQDVHRQVLRRFAEVNENRDQRLRCPISLWFLLWSWSCSYFSIIPGHYQVMGSEWVGRNGAVVEKVDSTHTLAVTPFTYEAFFWSFICDSDMFQAKIIRKKMLKAVITELSKTWHTANRLGTLPNVE